MNQNLRRLNPYHEAKCIQFLKIGMANTVYPFNEDNRNVTQFITPCGRYSYKTVSLCYNAPDDGYTKGYDETLSDRDKMSEAARPNEYHRDFYTLLTKNDSLPSECVIYVPSCDSSATNNAKESCSLMAYINEGIVGKNKTFRGPFGDRKVLYCDWTASGKSLNFIEDFISSEVLPTYGNTHTTTSFTSLQTTLFRHEARDIIRNAVRASADDAVIFVGSGCTGAIHKLIHNLHLDQPPIVIVGPFEHHSNILPWRHLAAKVLRAQTDHSGMVSMESLKSLLSAECIVAEELGCKLIVCMTAASNVTGIMVDVNALSSLIHHYGALAFWDYATAAPYVKIDMNPVVNGPDKDYVYKDAIYFSMHKFVGGPQTPGVLVAKRKLFKAGEVQPSGCGGGTVFFVRRDGHLYLKDVEEREEGGTPAIIESIRAGMIMQLKEAVTCEAIMEREDYIVKRVWKRLSDCENLIVLGGNQAARLPIISVLIRHVSKSGVDRNGGRGVDSPEHCLFLHHNFVATLLNDLFGIQTRGGCACAGPYAMDLLGIDEALARLYEEALLGCGPEAHKYSQEMEPFNREMIRPGFTRFSFPYFSADHEIDFVLDAVKFVAIHGWVFLPLYRYNSSTAEWVHRAHDPGRDRKWLGGIKYTDGCMAWMSTRQRDSRPVPCDEKACLAAAQEELYKAVMLIAQSPTSPVPDDTVYLDDVSQDLRWFLLPSEAASQLRNETHRLAVSVLPSSPWQPGSLATCFCPTSTSTGNLSTEIVSCVRSGPSALPCQNCPSCSARPKVKAITIDVTRILPYNHVRQRHVNTKGEVPNRRPPQLFTPTINNNIRKQQLASNQLDIASGQPTVETSTREELSSLNSESLVISRRRSVGVAVLKSVAGVQSDSCSTIPRVMALGTAASGEAAEEEADADGGRQVSNSADARQADASFCTWNSVLVGCARPSRTPGKDSLAASRLLASGLRNKNRSGWENPPSELSQQLVLDDAVCQFRTIQQGNRVSLVCLSGGAGKVSLSLPHCLRQFQNTPPPILALRSLVWKDGKEAEGKWFSLGAETLDPATLAYSDPRPLIPYLARLGVLYFFYEERGIVRQTISLPYRVSSVRFCSLCSPMKRDRIDTCDTRREEGYDDAVALSRWHLDDVAKRKNDLRVVRALTYVRGRRKGGEKQTDDGLITLPTRKSPVERNSRTRGG